MVLINRFQQFLNGLSFQVVVFQLLHLLLVYFEELQTQGLVFIRRSLVQKSRDNSCVQNLLVGSEKFGIQKQILVVFAKIRLEYKGLGIRVSSQLVIF